MKENYFTDIENLFSEETELPEALSKENVVKMLEEKNVKQKKKKYLFLKTLSAAACIAIAFVGATHLSNIKAPVNYKPVETTPPQYEKIDVGVKPTGLSTFSSEEDLKNYFLNIAKKISNDRIVYTADELLDGVMNFGAKAEDSVDESVAFDNLKATGSAAAPEAHSETNTQTAGVDEADIIKNDGRYIYTLSQRRLLTIVDTQTMTVVFSSEIKSPDKDKSLDLTEMYINENRLILTGTQYKTYADELKVKPFYSVNSRVIYDCYYGYGYEDEETVCVVYDMTDKANPVLLRYMTQDGHIANSRMIGSVIYLVTTYIVPVDDKKKTEEAYAPKVDGEQLSCDCIYITDKEEENRSYVIVSAFDTAINDSQVSKTSLIGGYDEIYCSDNTLYVVDWKWVGRDSENYAIGEEITNIYAFSLNGANVSYKCSGAVPGCIDNQYSLDEYKGYLRIATTGYNFNTDEDTSNLYVLDSNLSVVGQLCDIAKDEQIKSVRYMGDYAYVVTFRNTDPLFVIELKNPSLPEIKGEVKLPGFSEYLHPVGDGMLVGVGYDGDDANANFQSVKLSLFDVTDPNAPKEIDNHIIKNASTDVNYDPKAFMWYKEENTVGIPLQYDLTDGNDVIRGVSYQYKLMSIENGKFTEKLNFAHPGDESGWYAYFRGAYIGRTLYTVTDLSVASFDIQSGAQTGFVEYARRDN